MKKTLTGLLAMLCLIVWLPTGLLAQYTVTPVPPPPSFTFNDLWQLTVTRSNADAYTQFYISLRIYNGANQLKVKSNTATVTFPVGSQYYNQTNLMPLQPFTTSYYDASVLQQAIASGGMFPPGTYNLVYTLYGKTADGEFTPLSEDATQATVDVMWPPMLLSPPDGDTIDTQYPLLTWTPAFSSMFTGPITYTLNLVEVQNGQNGYQAIQSNPFYFTQSGIPITVLPYPSAAQLLDTSKVYAWQVHADGNGTAMGSSEIWTFRFGHRVRFDEKDKNRPFFLLSKTPKSEFVLVNDGILCLSHIEKLNDVDGKLAFTIINRQGETVADQTKLDQISTEGYNKIKISLCSNSTGFNLPKGHYTIRIKSQGGVDYFLNFFHNKTQNGCAE